MQNFFKFIWELKKDITRNEILPLATQLTYRFIFALFPFLIFLVALTGYLNINPEYMVQEVSNVFPADIAQTVNEIINEVTDIRNPVILTGSLLLSLFTIANGFRAIMRGINRVYGNKDDRHIVKKWLICGLLVIILAASILLALATIIFSNWLHTSTSIGNFGIVISASIFVVAVILIYNLASAARHRLVSLLPGAILTISVWVLSTTAFNFYVKNFTNMSVIYGSIASVFITMLWLNIISITILIGAQLNAKLEILKNSRLCDENCTK